MTLRTVDNARLKDGAKLDVLVIDGDGNSLLANDGTYKSGFGNMLKSENLSGLSDNATARSNLGLGQVDDTSDEDKPISTLTQTALDTKQNMVTTINEQTGTSYTFVLGDGNNTLCTFSNASAIAVTIPLNASVAFPVGTKIDCVQSGAGKVTFGGGGVTILSQSSNKSIAAQYVGVSLIKQATNTWYLFGNLIV